MLRSVQAFVVEAQLRLRAGIDPAAVGAAVTAELCGHWKHEGPCRWPHNNALAPSAAGVAAFRTLFIASPADEEEVRDRIDRALREATGWSVVETNPRPLAPDERPLADRLASA